MDQKYLIIVFTVIYFVIVLRKSAKYEIEFYDLVLLCSLAILPATMILLPKLFEYLSFMMNVKYPFVILFSLLLLLVFVILTRVLISIKKIRKENIFLIQRLSMLESLRESDSIDEKK